MIPDNVLESYLSTALWSSTDNSDESGGEPLDANYCSADFPATELAKAKEDLASFFDEASNLSGFADLDLGQVAHDFWLTRNGHGAGFWDGDYPTPLGDQLTTLSKPYGEVNVYVSDDGKLYFN